MSKESLSVEAWSLLRTAAGDFVEDDCLSSGAAIAFYTVFSLPPLLTIALTLSTFAGFTEQHVTNFIKQQLGLPMSPLAASPAWRDLEASDSEDVKETPDEEGVSPAPGNLGWLSRTAGIVLLLVSASGVFGQLQFSLNKAWAVTPDPLQGGVREFLAKRLLSMGLVLVLGFILLVSLLLTAFMDELLRYAWQSVTEVQILGLIVNEILSFSIATLLFAAIFQILPDARIRWQDVWVGAVFTALLFVIGKALIGWYLAAADVGADWGASAVSVIGALVWVYYSSLIVLFGAELTQVWAKRSGHLSPPEEGAVRVVQEEHLVRVP